MKYENVIEEMSELRNNQESFNEEELIEFIDLLEQIEKCSCIKCLENISHTLININLIKIFVKQQDKKILFFKALLQKKKLEIKQLEQDLKDFEK